MFRGLRGLFGLGFESLPDRPTKRYVPPSVRKGRKLSHERRRKQIAAASRKRNRL